MRLVSLLLMTIIAASNLPAATVPELAKPYTLVRIDLGPMESAVVKSFRVVDGGTGLVKDAIVSVSVVETVMADGRGYCVFTGPPGSYSVDIFGGDHPQSYTCLIAYPPGPTPPSPVPTPTPTPVPVPVPDVVPDTVLNKVGVGATAWREAVKVGDKRGADSLAVFIGGVKDSLYAGRITPASARLSLEASPDPFKAWAKTVLAKIDEVAASRPNGTNLMSWVTYLHEVQSGLVSASK